MKIITKHKDGSSFLSNEIEVMVGSSSFYFYFYSYSYSYSHLYQSVYFSISLFVHAVIEALAAAVISSHLVAIVSQAAA